MLMEKPVPFPPFNPIRHRQKQLQLQRSLLEAKPRAGWGFYEYTQRFLVPI